VPPGNPENVSMVSPDGLQLLGTFYPAAGAGPWPAVLLLHMLGSDREAWAETGLPDALAGAGFAVLALDMRGHGDTGGTRDWARAEDDLLRVWRYLVDRGDVDPRRIAIVGASIGANLALRMGAREPFIPTVVLLSPGLDYQGVTTADTLTNFAGRPLLVVASSEDGYAADSSRTLAEQAGESAQLLIYDGAGHGTNMFGPQPDLIDVILDWLGDNL
jgi:alpha-beta hydrolase superfamily lysophospholipase